mmetsp:Transcript_24523/g.61644  ORF Transcript_24523/g.61644 Transcript_24523/m.61644 type:complete len:227 (-) Transcript_24523:1641-2321(-)
MAYAAFMAPAGASPGRCRMMAVASAPPGASTTTVSSSSKSPRSSALASGVSSSRCTARFTGRAPYTGSKPRAAMNSIALSATSRVIFLSFSRLATRATCSPTICLICTRLSGSKKRNSSMRLMNSGRKLARTAAITRSRDASTAAGSTEPIDSSMLPLPRLLVMMSTAFLKPTTRPWLSVTRPSSRICSRTLNTSGCAFSTSSNRMTQYGLRRTASVSCPPSSKPT